MLKKDNKVEREIIEEVSLSDSKPEQIEVLDLTNNIENTLEVKKENKIIIFIIVFIILCVLIFPVLTGFFKKSNNAVTTSSGKIITKDTNDGYLVIGSDEGSITAEKIQFYAFQKRGNNKISYVFLSDKAYKKVDDLNIYIEIYNSQKNIIYREKFLPSSSVSKERNNATIELVDKLYSDAAYVKVVILEKNDFSKTSNTLTCEDITENEDYKVTNTITYNFSVNGLNGYIVDRKAELLEGQDYSPELNDVFMDEKDKLEKYNFEDFIFETKKIHYSVSLLNDNGDYKELYLLGTTLREVKLKEQLNNWSCK